MMAIIEGIDFSIVADEALEAAKNAVVGDWDEMQDLVENIGRSLISDVSFLVTKKATGEFNEDDAKVFMEDQKMLARIRLRSIAIMTLQLVERVWNAIANVFRAAIKNAIGWTVL
jgi:hypothetical protein